MARVRGVATSEGEVALAAATAKTIVQVVSAANHPIAIKGVSVSFDGVSASAEPVLVQLMRQTTAGTSSAGTPTEETAFGVTLQTTSRITFTAEPTLGGVLRTWEVHPQAGIIEKLTIEDELILGSSGRVGLRCTAPAVVNVVGYISFEE